MHARQTISLSSSGFLSLAKVTASSPVILLYAYLPYLIFGAVSYYPAHSVLKLNMFGPMHNPDVPIGYKNLFLTFLQT